MTSRSTLPEVIDDDVQRTTEHTLRSLSEGGDETIQKLEPEVRRRLTEAICVALQSERNGWKERNQDILQEIDRQHRASIVVESSLQSLLTGLGLNKDRASPPSSGCQSSSAISSLERYIKSLHAKVDEAEGSHEMNNHVEELKRTVTSLEGDRKKQALDAKDKGKEILWLQNELNTVRHQLGKLRRIVLNYNQSHSTNFHLEEESTDNNNNNTNNNDSYNNFNHRSQSDPLMMSRERTYVEGDQLNYFSTTGEEIVVWKLRNKQARDVGGGGGGYCSGGSTSRGVGSRGGGGGGGGRTTGVTQCLRCNQLFKPTDNNKKACQFHKKGRQIREQYDPSGRLLRVLYTWACCQKGLDAPGCTHGTHI